MQLAGPGKTPRTHGTQGDGDPTAQRRHTRAHGGDMPAKKPTDFKNDEVVWVKLGSYPWWPARVAEKDGTL